ncbi:hypothetical protein HK405_000642, partial [Cladochytrium tenue]
MPSSRCMHALARTAIHRPAAFAVQRASYATERQPPEQAAAALINMFPGQTLTQKASSVVLASSVAAWLISKEIYVIDGEFFEVLALFGAYYLWYIGGKDGVKEFFNERQDTIRRVLNEAREQHKEVVKERM